MVELLTKYAAFLCMLMKSQILKSNVVNCYFQKWAIWWWIQIWPSHFNSFSELILNPSLMWHVILSVYEMVRLKSEIKPSISSSKMPLLATLPRCKIQFLKMIYQIQLLCGMIANTSIFTLRLLYFENTCLWQYCSSKRCGEDKVSTEHHLQVCSCLASWYSGFHV